MSEPAPYCTDKELIRRMGVGLNSGARELKRMREHPACPPRSVGGKTYWPSFRDFLDIWNKRTLATPGNPAGHGDNHGQTSHRGRPRPSLEAAERRLGRGMGG